MYKAGYFNKNFRFSATFDAGTEAIATGRGCALTQC